MKNTEAPLKVVKSSYFNKTTKKEKYPSILNNLINNMLFSDLINEINTTSFISFET